MCFSVHGCALQFNDIEKFNEAGKDSPVKSASLLFYEKFNGAGKGSNEMLMNYMDLRV